MVSLDSGLFVSHRLCIKSAVESFFLVICWKFHDILEVLHETAYLGTIPNSLPPTRACKSYLQIIQVVMHSLTNFHQSGYREEYLSVKYSSCTSHWKYPRVSGCRPPLWVQLLCQYIFSELNKIM